mmetsp:Transcript_23780/g.60653  ORF Transcript_23780/g.60653 Transcript_23780/m.60653 type:complete len:642 (-) Transcript_23780:1238-3163(-)
MLNLTSLRGGHGWVPYVPAPMARPRHQVPARPRRVGMHVAESAASDSTHAVPGAQPDVARGVTEGKRSPDKRQLTPGHQKLMNDKLGHVDGPLGLAQALDSLETEAKALRARALMAESEAKRFAEKAAEYRSRAERAEDEAMRATASSNGKPSVWSMAADVKEAELRAAAPSKQPTASTSGLAPGKPGKASPPAPVGPQGKEAELMKEVKQLRAALEAATAGRTAAEERANVAELRAMEAQDALADAQSVSQQLHAQYTELVTELEAYRRSHTKKGAADPTASQDLDGKVEDLQAQLEDLDYRLNWALRDLRAHQLVLRAQGELNMHLSGLPADMQQQVFDQVDNGAELLGDGGSATVHAIVLNGQELAVKVMPLYDINTARPYHFRDICTTFLRNRRSPFIEMPLHTFLRLKDDEAEGTQYYLYTLWPRRHMDVDQLLCRRPLTQRETITIMLHVVLALQDLRLARMVHADVKPPNILVMLDDNGKVVSAHLTDFGSVQFVAPGGEAAPAIWDGQLAWNWPPEQRELVYLDACDAWGLALLFSCMKVHNPTAQDVTDALQDAGLSEAEFARVRDAQLLPELADDIPEMRALTLLMRRCVARDPHKRPKMAELANCLQDLYNSAYQLGPPSALLATVATSS